MTNSFILKYRAKSKTLKEKSMSFKNWNFEKSKGTLLLTYNF